jgi:rod shape-determining protein MreD
MVTVVTFLSFHAPNPMGLALSFFMGICLDLGSAVLVGPWAGAFVVVFLLLSSVTQRIFVDSPLTAFMAVLCAALLAQGIFIALSVQFRAFEFELGALASQVFLEALFSAFCAPLCFAGLRRLRIVPPQRVV